MKPSGKLIKYEPWEIEIVNALFPNDNRGPLPFTLFLLSIPKKIGKTSFITSLICWHLFSGFSDSPGLPLILFVANSKSQVRVLGFEKLAWAIQNDEYLSSSCRIYGDRIVTSTGGEARILSSKSASAAGGEPSLVFFDEIHSADEKMIEKLFAELTNPGTRTSIVCIASYAGHSKNSLLYRLIELAESGKDKRFYHLIGHDPYLSKRPDHIQHMESEKLRMLPGEFTRVWENVFADQRDVYIPYEDWQNCYDVDLMPLAPCTDKPLTLGVDCSARHDTASVVGVYRDEDDIVKVAYVQVFVPPEDGKDLDLENTVAASIRYLSESFHVIKTNYDERYMLSISQRLEVEGVGGEWERVSSTRSNMAPIFESLRQGVKRRALRHFGDRALDLHVNSAVCEVTSAGIILRKPTKSSKIDSCVALSLACKDLLGGKEKVKIQLLRGEQSRPSLDVPTRSDWLKPTRLSLGDQLKGTGRNWKGEFWSR